MTKTEATRIARNNHSQVCPVAANRHATTYGYFYHSRKGTYTVTAVDYRDAVRKRRESIEEDVARLLDPDL